MDPVARTADPATSWDAADSVSKASQTETQAKILKALGSAWMTDEQIADIAGKLGWFTTSSGLRTRRSELVRDGLVVDSGLKHKLKTGRYAIVWRTREV